MATRKGAGDEGSAARARRASPKRKTAAKRPKPAAGKKPKPATSASAKSQRRISVGASDRTVSARAAHRRRRKPETLRLRTVTPSFTVENLERSIEFYSGVLGFVVGERWIVEGRLRGVMLQAGKCALGLSQDDGAKGRNRRKGLGVRIWLETVQDLDALAERLWAGGIQATGPRLEDWGTRTLAFSDPDGYQITFTELETR